MNTKMLVSLFIVFFVYLIDSVDASDGSVPPPASKKTLKRLQRQKVAEKVKMTQEGVDKASCGAMVGQILGDFFAITYVVPILEKTFASQDVLLFQRNKGVRSTIRKLSDIAESNESTDDVRKDALFLLHEVRDLKGFVAIGRDYAKVVEGLKSIGAHIRRHNNKIVKEKVYNKDNPRDDVPLYYSAYIVPLFHPSKKDKTRLLNEGVIDEGLLKLLEDELAITIDSFPVMSEIQGQDIASYIAGQWEHEEVYTFLRLLKNKKEKKEYAYLTAEQREKLDFLQNPVHVYAARMMFRAIITALEKRMISFESPSGKLVGVPESVITIKLTDIVNSFSSIKDEDERIKAIAALEAYNQNRRNRTIIRKEMYIIVNWPENMAFRAEPYFRPDDPVVRFYNGDNSVVTHKVQKKP